nr:hypothetical protein [Tanacetum cinerariifolium]
MTTPNVTSSTDSQMHNNIMAAGSRDRPLMLAPGRYPQWRSRFLRYVDTRPNGEALRKCILSGPYKPTTVLIHAVEATDDSLAVPEHTTVKTPTNMSPENKAHFLAEKEAVHLILTGIGDDIYSTVDVCQTTQEMWEVIERLQQGKEIAKPITPPSESASEEDNDPEQAQRDKDMQKNLAIIAKYFKKIYKPTNNNLRTSSNSRNKNVDTTLWYKNDNQSGWFRNQRTVNVARARENVGSPVVQQSGIQCFNYKEFGHFAKECRKPRRVKDFAYHKITISALHYARNILILDGEETLALERESRSKLNKDSVHSYDYTKLNSLYEIFKPPTLKYETQLAHANETRRKMWRKFFVKSKPNIYKNVGFLPVSKSISKSRQAYNVMTNNINHFKQIVDDAWIKHSKDLFRAPTTHDMEILIQTFLMPLAIKTQSDSLKFVHEFKQEMHADLKYVESLENEIDELASDKDEFSDMYDVILQECVSKDVMCSYLMSLS